MKVYKAIQQVMESLSKIGVSKSEENKFDNYKFRGIDAIYNAMSPLLARHGLMILPRVLSRHCDERVSAKGGALFYVTVDCEFDFVCAEDGSKHTVRTFGEAMDRGDKATNKAMSAAYKYACFQAFCIPTEGDNDADATTHEVKPKELKPKGPISATQGALDSLPVEEQDYIRELAMTVVDILNGDGAAPANEHIKAENLDADQKTALWSLLDSKTRSALKKG